MNSKIYNKLLLISFGNVQNFISNARKTIDLYNGSMIVQKLVLATQEILYKINVNEMSSVKIDSDKNDIIDRIFFIDTGDKVEEKYVPNFLLYRCLYAGNRTNAQLENCIFEMLKEELNKTVQERNFFIPEDIIPYVVIVDHDENDYQNAYAKIHQKLNGYKNSEKNGNTFCNKQSGGNNEIAKHVCSMCGIRYGEEYIDKVFLWNKKLEEKKIEYLCEECKGKREWGKNQSEGKSENGEKGPSKRWNKTTHFDSVDSIAKLVKNDGTYYGIIRADMDDMGKKMGTVDRSYKEMGLREWQNNLKIFLKEFMEKMTQYLSSMEEGKELLIYAGGDDILFFCPIDKIIPTLKKIDELIEKCGKSIGEQKIDISDKITMSKCVTITHKHVPLKRVIQLSKEYLEQTKSFQFKKGYHRKNKVGFLMIFGGYDFDFTVIKQENMGGFSHIFQGVNKEYSRSFFHQLQNQIIKFGTEIPVGDDEYILEIIKNDMRRILSRKIKNNTVNVEQYVDELDRLYLMFTEDDAYGRLINSPYFFNMLHIMDKWATELKGERGSNE